MGKKLLFILFLSIASFANAQDIQLRDKAGTILNGDTITFTEYYNSNAFANTFDHKEFIRFFNNTSTTMVLKLQRTEITFIPGSYEYYCYGQSCLTPVKAGDSPFRTSNDTLRVDPNSYGVGDAPFTVYIDSASSGTALYKYTFTDDLSRSSADVYIRWVIIDNSANGPNFQLRDSSGNDITGDTLELNSFYDDVTNQSFVQNDLVRFYNNTPAKQIISVFRFEQLTINNSYDQFCFGSSCSPLMAAGSNRFLISTDSIEIAPNSYFPVDTIFSVRLDSAKSGNALYSYSFSDKKNKNNLGIIYVKWNVVDVTSLEENKMTSSFSIYPNPAESSTTLNFEKELNFNHQEIQVLNILGEQVLSTPLRKGVKTFEFDVNAFPKGIYFVNVIINGERVNSKKMIVK